MNKYLLPTGDFVPHRNFITSGKVHQKCAALLLATKIIIYHTYNLRSIVRRDGGRRTQGRRRESKGEKPHGLTGTWVQAAGVKGGGK